MIDGAIDDDSEGELRKSIRKACFSTAASFTEEYNLKWQPKCGGVSQSLNEGKDFDNNVEAHESTCNTRPAG